MIKTLFRVGIIAAISALLGCKPATSVSRSPKSEQLYFLVTGIARHWVIHDVSKTASARNERTELGLELLEAHSPQIPDYDGSLPKSFLLNRNTLERDKSIHQGDTLKITLGVDKWPQPTQFYWLNTEKL